MEPLFEKILQVQKEAWNKSSAGWKKWDELMMHFLSPLNIQMIQSLELKDSDTVLDVATGTGEPGLTISSIVRSGKVIATDLSEDMLSVAREKANIRAINNFETICSDTFLLPFDDNSFDAVTCRLGIMFFPDIQLGLKEMRRVLKPGGRMVISVWGSHEENFWINASMETMISRLGLNPTPGAPGPFRCSEAGFMTDQLKNAGLIDIQEKRVEGKLKCYTIETYWNFITDAGSPMAYAKADDVLKKEIRNEIISKVKQKCPDGNIALDSLAIVVEGVK
jgi:SAM-dependent methyltransferase